MQAHPGPQIPRSVLTSLVTSASSPKLGNWITSLDVCVCSAAVVRTDLACKLLDFALSKRITPDVITYTMLIGWALACDAWMMDFQHEAHHLRTFGSTVALVRWLWESVAVADVASNAVAVRRIGCGCRCGAVPLCTHVFVQFNRILCEAGMSGLSGVWFLVVER
eukprot:1973264-Amphidinium_carterae.1